MFNLIEYLFKKKDCIFLTCLLVFLIVNNASAQVIATIAGIGRSGYTGDGKNAMTAELFYPTSIAIDADGNLFFADENNNVVRKIKPDGIINTVAGTGKWGYKGDGGQATAADLAQPTSVAVDGGGNLFIADYENNCIRKVAKDGIITTVAGKGSSGFNGDGGAATAAEFNLPIGVAVDKNNNLYVADQGNNRVRKITKDGFINTFAGTGTDGNKGDGGAATAARFSQPICVTLDDAGNVYFTDAINCCIRKVDNNGIISTVAGNGNPGFSGDGGPATNAELIMPWGLAVDRKGNIFIADQLNLRIRKVSTDGIISTYAGSGRYGYSGDGGQAVKADLGFPWGVAVDKDGVVYISDRGVNCIRTVKLNNGKISKNEIKHSYTLNPNAGNDVIEIVQNDIQDTKAEVKIIGATGELINGGSVTFTKGKTQFSTLNVKSGIYVIEIKDDKGNNETYRILIDKQEGEN